MKWYRLYNEVYKDTKVQGLRPELFRFWVNVMCIASEVEPRGELPPAITLKRLLNLTLPTVERFLGDLEGAGLLARRSVERPSVDAERTLGGRSEDAQRTLEGSSKDAASTLDPLMPHNWDERQPDSDDAAKRKRDSRAKTSGDRHPTKSRDGPESMSRDMSVTRVRGITDLDLDLDLDKSPLTPPVPAAETIPIPVIGPEYTRVGELAIELSGDFSWGAWVTRLGKFGHPASSIEQALRQASNSGKLKQAYVASILEDWAANGMPQKAAPRSGTSGATPDRHLSRTAQRSRQVAEAKAQLNAEEAAENGQKMG